VPLLERVFGAPFFSNFGTAWLLKGKGSEGHYLYFALMGDAVDREDPGFLALRDKHGEEWLRITGLVTGVRQAALSLYGYARRLVD